MRGFAIPETAESKAPKAWVLHREHGDEKQVGTHNMAVQRDLYTLFSQDGAPDYRIEQEFSRLEGVVSDLRFWPDLCDDFIDFGSLSIRKLLSLFLATLFLRNPARKGSMIEFRQELLELLDQAPRDRHGIPAVESIVLGDREVPFDKDGWRAMKALSEDELHQQFIHSIRPQVGALAQGLMKKRWSMLFVDEPLFVTSTDPVFVIDPDLQPSQLLGKGAKVICPISSRRMLCLDDLDEPGDQYYPLDDTKAVGLYTYFTWVNTTGFMISPRPMPIVLQEMLEFMDDEKCRYEQDNPGNEEAEYPSSRGNGHFGIRLKCSATAYGKSHVTSGPLVLPAQEKQKIGRNASCPCGSGEKYKRCCGR
ncbi:MAG: DUF4238 domain-containing protein [Phycisphaerae bacterium]|nr:DUF4238 domain-containing protein [Phycisphaerae bacterium]